jgi:hypothetical protein
VLRVHARPRTVWPARSGKRFGLRVTLLTRKPNRLRHPVREVHLGYRGQRHSRMGTGTSHLPSLRRPGHCCGHGHRLMVVCVRLGVSRLIRLADGFGLYDRYPRAAGWREDYLSV